MEAPFAAWRLLGALGASEEPASEIKKKEERLKRTEKKLQDELAAQIKNHDKIMAQCKEAKDSWLDKDVTVRNLTVTLFLQHCVLPRCLTSGIDAIYCAKFLALVVDLGVPYFSVIHFYDQICSKILGAALTSFTANEATRFGRFFNAALTPFDDWKRNADHYQKTCANKPGFATDFFHPYGARMSFAQFRTIVMRFHKNMMKNFLVALSSSNRQLITNALLVLTKIGTVFPRTASIGRSSLSTNHTQSHTITNQPPPPPPPATRL